MEEKQLPIGTTIKQPPTGVTEESKKFVEKHLKYVGKPSKVILKYDKHHEEFHTIICGTECAIDVDGFAWGYGGEGPHGLLWLLHKLGMTIHDIAKIPREVKRYEIAL